MGLASAGTENGASGHHHLLIDVGLPPTNKPIPSDFNHLHFGSGQSEAEITLPPANTRCNSCSPTRITFRIRHRSIRTGSA
jgi:hypothetical protein